MTTSKNNRREILLVSNFSGSDYAPFRQSFSQALGDPALSLDFQEITSVAELPVWFARNPSPHVLILDWTESARLKVERKQVEQALQGVRELDRSLCVLMLADQMTAAGDTMHWLDRGATGLLHRGFESSTLTEALGEILSRRLNSQIQRSARVPAQHEISLRLASLEQALVAETLNVGLGGLFARVVPVNARPGDPIDFRLVLAKEVADSGWSDDANLGEIRGTGIVAWVRPYANAEGPEGVGIQFVDLEPASREILEKFVSSRRVRAFIPKA